MRSNIVLTADFGEWVRRTKARRRFRRAAVAAALAATSSEAVRLRERNSMLSSVWLPDCSWLSLLSIDASIERYREAATAVPVRSSTDEVAVDVIAVIIVHNRLRRCCCASLLCAAL